MGKLECLHVNYIHFAINNLEISEQTNKPNVKFDVDYELEPMHFYVEFLIRIESQYTTSGIVRFKIFSNGTFKGLKFQKVKKNREKKRLCLGSLEANTMISLVGLPLANLIQPHELTRKKFVADLSKYCI